MLTDNSINQTNTHRMNYSAFAVICAALLLNSCSSPQTPINIAVKLSYHGQSVNCHTPVEGLVLNDFRLYIHDIELLDELQQWQSLKLTHDNQWQNANTVLLDLEDGTQGCGNGNTLLNTQIKGMAPKAQYQAIRFTLGVPFTENHQNPLTAIAPLNEGSMHWHWQSGYKFVRAEFNYQQNSRRVHIGSINCQGEIDNISHCETPNRPTITLQSFSPNSNQLEIRLDALFDGQSMQADEKVTCMGSAEEPWCQKAQQWLGLTNSPQTAFHIAGN